MSARAPGRGGGAWPRAAAAVAAALVLVAVVLAVERTPDSDAGGGRDARPAPVRLMATGDSYTVGFDNDTGGRGGYRPGLFKSLGLARYRSVGQYDDASAGVPSGLDARHDRHEGVPGRTIGDIAADIERMVRTYRPAVVVLQGGTNDLLDGATPTTVHASLLLALDNALDASPTVEVYVMDVLPIRPGGSAAYPQITEAAIAETNAGLAEDMAKRGSRAHHVPLSAITWDPSVDWSSDGLHLADPPNGYAKLVPPIVSAVRR